MKTAKHISALLCGILLISILFVTCDNISNDPSPDNNLSTLLFTEDNNELHVTTLDNNIILTFRDEDFNEDLPVSKLKSTLSIKNLPFTCQKDEFFSNNIWIIKPDNVKFDNEVFITIKYTHEEFAPDFNTNGLQIYKLKREFINSDKNDNEQLLIRVTDMSLLDHCIQNDEMMYVSTSISELGGFVLGRKVH